MHAFTDRTTSATTGAQAADFQKNLLILSTVDISYTLQAHPCY
jgi:hypothetical protein